MRALGGNKEWLLALDLSTPRGVLALEGPGGLIHRVIEGGSRVSHLFVAAGETVTAAGITPREIGLIGVGRGPGSFTGVRVGVMAAKTLALVLGVPLVAPGSLEVTAMGMGGMAEAVFVALDARRGEVYYALYRLEDGYPAVLEGPAVARPEEAAGSLSRWREEIQGVMAVTGTGVDAFPEAWPRDLAVAHRDSPGPEGLARLCRRLFSHRETCDPLELLPLYLRRPDARERYSRGEEGKGCG